MHLPHIRFTISTIAVVTINLWAVLNYYPQRYKICGILFFEYPSFLGAIPLAEFALVGVALTVSKPLPEPQLDHSSHPPSFTFLSLTFLILGLLLTQFSPFHVFNSEPVTHQVSTYFIKTLPSIWGLSSCPDAVIIALTCLVVGAMVSGPALLLSGIGHLLTAHFVQQPPRHHFRITPLLLILTLALADLALWLTFDGQL
jgi:hypothetical protein